MTDNDEPATEVPFWKKNIGWIAAICLLVVVCAGLSVKLINAQSSQAAPDMTASDAISAGEQATDDIVPIADHNYTDRIGDTYYYEASISDDERSKGKASPDAFGFRYVGCRVQNDICLAAVDSRGLILMAASCSQPCHIIKYGNGDTIIYNPKSVIGMAFEDARRGKLVKTTLYEREYRDGIAVPASPSPTPTASAAKPETSDVNSSE